MHSLPRNYLVDVDCTVAVDVDLVELEHQKELCESRHERRASIQRDAVGTRLPYGSTRRRV